MTPIVLWCENLLQITEDQPQSLHFAHNTIREFITKGDLPTQLSDFHIDVDEADHFAGEICITYLHLNDFKTAVARRPQPLRVNPVAIAGTALGRGPKVTELTSRFADVLGHRRARADPDLAGVIASYDRADDMDSLQQKHPFLKYAAKHWVSHSVRFQNGRSSTWILWHRIITNGHSLVHVPWQESIFYRREEAILIWSHQTHHYALLRYANTVPGLSDLRRIELMRSSAAEGDSEAIAIFLDARCSIPCISRALQAAISRSSSDFSMREPVLMPLPLNLEDRQHSRRHQEVAISRSSSDLLTLERSRLSRGELNHSSLDVIKTRSVSKCGLEPTVLLILSLSLKVDVS
jgi:hypothetical protein